MNTKIMHEALAGSMNGTLAFPDVVRMLTLEGVESYRADLVRREETFYMPNGETLVAGMSFPPAGIAENFSTSSLVEAIRASQAGRQAYPEFLDRAMRAGVTSYMVFLAGGRCIYFGRKGEFHVEEFPPAKD